MLGSSPVDRRPASRLTFLDGATSGGIRGLCDATVRSLRRLARSRTGWREGLVSWNRADLDRLLDAVDALLANSWIPISGADELLELVEPFQGLDWADSLDGALSLYEPWGAPTKSDVAEYLVDGAHLRSELMAARRELVSFRSTIPGSDEAATDSE